VKVTIAVEMKGAAPMKITVDGTPKECAEFMKMWLMSLPTSESFQKESVTI